MINYNYVCNKKSEVQFVILDFIIVSLKIIKENEKQKKLLGVCLSLIFGAAVFTAVSASSDQTLQNDVMMANIEALSQDELYKGQRSRTEKCPDGMTRVYCVTGKGNCLKQECN